MGIAENSIRDGIRPHGIAQGVLLFLNNQTAWHFSGHTSSGKDVVVISDSVPDVKRGLDNGAFMVAVASNLASRAVLAAHRPDVLPDDFTDRDLLCRLKPASDPLQRSAVRTAVPAVPE